MKLKLRFVTARNAVIEIEDGGSYNTKEQYHIEVEEGSVFSALQCVTTIHNLKPSTEYSIKVRNDTEHEWKLKFTTKAEYVTLNVKEFGAKGDGIQNDTLFIQATIMACPMEGRVLIPKGKYLITSLFLKSNIKIELAEGAVLLAELERSNYPIYPGLIESQDEKREYNLGSWEGNPLPMYTGIITGIGVENVVIYGNGCIDGRAGQSDWWVNEKEMRGAFRPRLLFLSHSSNVTVQGIHFMNSPAWSIHPYFSENLAFINLYIENPQNSPNTDGLNPESCKNVLIIGNRFTLGDDCIALKSGKIYMGKKYKTPCEDITIKHCFMENGHGAVTIGSEMAAGIRNVLVQDCLFKSTDRGLRIKTRRGRGKDAVIDNITFDRIFMENVMTPFVVNCFYFCDPDGRSKYVQSKEIAAVDERTPQIKSLTFSNITCRSVHVAAAYFYGLPEQKIERIAMDNVTVSYADDAKCDVPAMMSGIEPCTKMGLFAANVDNLILNKINIEGQDGEKCIITNVDRIVET
ncbi:MAG: glycoside hydrolase family 28 protein [Mobilitalea sp.]